MAVPDKSQLPDFLIIGAMKAGTTTLYRDLEPHPQIFLPQEKEPETLVRLGNDHTAIAKDYQSLFRGSQEHQLRGEASTAYTKRPEHEGAASRAFALCGNELKLIYLMREPVSRMISHYRHEYGLRMIDLPMEEAFNNDHRYFDFGRYAYQLEPWLAKFPAENFLFLSFEEYVTDRSKTLEKVCDFLGIDFALLPQPDEEKAYNRSDGKFVAIGIMGRFVRSAVYQRGIKRMLPRGVREWAMSALLPKARKAGASLPNHEKLGLEARYASEAPAPYPANR